VSADSGTLAISILTGGAAGSIITIITSRLLDRRKESTLRKRVRAIIRNELSRMRDYIQQRLLDTHKSTVLDFVPLVAGSVEVVRGEEIVASMQYPKMNVDLKVRVFDSDTLAELDHVYFAINTMYLWREIAYDDKGNVIFGGNGGFAYKKDRLTAWRDMIDAAVKKMSDA
jgi:hypothetical protein